MIRSFIQRLLLPAVLTLSCLVGTLGPVSTAAAPAPPPAPGRPSAPPPAPGAGAARPTAPASTAAPLPTVGPRALPTVAAAPGGGGSRGTSPSGSSGRASAGSRPALVPRYSGRPSPSAGLSGSQKVERYWALIVRAARAAGADPAIVAGLIETENSGEGAISPAGAMGLMQLMPDKFAPGDDPYDPVQNVRRGAQHVRLLQDRWPTPAQVAAAYFGAIDGAGNVTGASDGGITGHGYVARFLPAYQRHRQRLDDVSEAEVAPGDDLDLGLDLGQALTLADLLGLTDFERPSAWVVHQRGTMRFSVVPLPFP